MNEQKVTTSPDSEMVVEEIINLIKEKDKQNVIFQFNENAVELSDELRAICEKYKWKPSSCDGAYKMKVCPDEVAGIVRININNRCGVVEWVGNALRKEHLNGKKCDKVNNIIDFDRQKIYSKTDYKRLVIVLESPHVSEFSDKEHIEPAKGETGNNISKYLCDVLFRYILLKNQENIGAYSVAHSLDNGQYEVCLVNAIQYQCSLGLSLIDANVKNRALAELWENSQIEANFIKRLKEYEPDIIINSCTETIKQDVQEVINAAFPNVIRLQSAHPSSPHFATKGLSIVT